MKRINASTFAPKDSLAERSLFDRVGSEGTAVTRPRLCILIVGLVAVLLPLAQAAAQQPVSREPIPREASAGFSHLVSTSANGEPASITAAQTEPVLEDASSDNLAAAATDGSPFTMSMADARRLFSLAALMLVAGIMLSMLKNVDHTPETPAE